MSEPEPKSRRATADQLYRALAMAHSPLAAALMAAAVTGEWPSESYCRAMVNVRQPS